MYYIIITPHKLEVSYTEDSSKGFTDVDFYPAPSGTKISIYKVFAMNDISKLNLPEIADMVFSEDEETREMVLGILMSKCIKNELSKDLEES